MLKTQFDKENSLFVLCTAPFYTDWIEHVCAYAWMALEVAKDFMTYAKRFQHVKVSFSTQKIPGLKEK